MGARACSAPLAITTSLRLTFTGLLVCTIMMPIMGALLIILLGVPIARVIHRSGHSRWWTSQTKVQHGIDVIVDDQFLYDRLSCLQWPQLSITRFMVLSKSQTIYLSNVFCPPSVPAGSIGVHSNWCQQIHTSRIAPRCADVL